jgi:hypothetical protein
MTWKDEDEVTTTFKSIKQSQQESYSQGWQEAIQYVIDIIGEMKYTEYDNTTLEELEQRIV